MANNPYVNKVDTADGVTIMDITDTTATEDDVLSGKVFYKASGARAVGTLSLLDSIYPVGSVYICANNNSPSTLFGGTWVEFGIQLTWNDVENGTRSYTDGTGTGTLHFWRRTA